MSEPVHPLRRAADLRRLRRRADDADAPEAAPEERLLPVPVDEVHTVPPPPPRAGPGAAYAAHLLGQKEQRRGLKGGQEVLDAARSAYLGAEFSGGADRRPSKGLLKKREV